MRRGTVIQALLAGAMLAGCEDPGFRQRSEVFSPRVLAMVASHPEVGPFDVVRVSAMVVDAEGRPIDDPAAFEWRACLKADDVPGLGGMMFQGGEPDEGCGGFPDLTSLGDPDGTDFVLAAPPAPEALIAMASEMFGDDLPMGAIEAIVEQVG